MRVLMAVDGSPNATAAIQAATRLLSGTDRQVHLLHVVPELRVPFAGRAPSESLKDLEAVAKAALEQARQLLLQAGIDAFVISESGFAPTMLATESSDYDVIVVGARGRGETMAGMGSVSNHVADCSTRNVFLGRQLVRYELPRILIALDHSLGSHIALEALEGLIEPHSVDITFLHVVETPAHPGVSHHPGVNSSTVEEHVVSQLHDERNLLTTETCKRIAKDYPAANKLVNHGNAGEEILRVAHDGGYDLIVVGSNRGIDPSSTMLGHVSKKVAHNAHCSVLIARALTY